MPFWMGPGTDFFFFLNSHSSSNYKKKKNSVYFNRKMSRQRWKFEKLIPSFSNVFIVFSRKKNPLKWNKNNAKKRDGAQHGGLFIYEMIPFFLSHIITFTFQVLCATILGCLKDRCSTVLLDISVWHLSTSRWGCADVCLWLVCDANLTERLLLAESKVRKKMDTSLTFNVKV